MKRIISCLLIILMLIPCIAGCNNTNEPDQNNPQSEAQNKNESLEQGKENVVTEPPVAYNTYDLSEMYEYYKSQAEKIAEGFIESQNNGSFKKHLELVTGFEV